MSKYHPCRSVVSDSPRVMRDLWIDPQDRPFLDNSLQLVDFENKPKTGYMHHRGEEILIPRKGGLSSVAGVMTMSATRSSIAIAVSLFVIHVAGEKQRAVDGEAANPGITGSLALSDCYPLAGFDYFLATLKANRQIPLRREEGMPLVYPNIHETIAIIRKPRLLICDLTAGPSSMSEAAHTHGYEVSRMNILRPISAEGRTLLSAVDIVLLDISTSSHEILRDAVCKLDAAIGIYSLRPRLLCFSTVHRNPQVALGLEKCGARFARVASPAMLFESVELLMAEMDELQRNGPRFHIVHRFSEGICAPGEEISAVLLECAGDFFQLPLGLTERFVFDFVAQRRLAVDSLQIVSGLSGDRFYSQHAANSGRKQVNKVRLPTIKVSAQRIRDGMRSVFDKAKIGFDPYQVLRSCLAEGTNRVLYKLCARVSWRHLP
ncbi:MAG TPA: hypothetical protein VI386_35710 [Candidatus Sulfotelmatobacter sp.]